MTGPHKLMRISIDVTVGNGLLYQNYKEIKYKLTFKLKETCK